MQFGKLTVIGVDESKASGTQWECLCECGNIRSVRQHSLLDGHIKSCGCLVTASIMENLTKHGKYYTPLYAVWRGMNQRCYNEKHIDHKWYSERGIGVCDEWRNNFESFYSWSQENGYKNGLSLDRIDNTKGYSPENCRFVTAKDQANNRTTNIMITHDGRTQTLKQWTEELGLKYHTIYERVRIRGIPFEKAISM